MREWILVGVAVALAVAWYFSFSASRLDRLHHRVEGARAMLDTQLVRRAEAAVELASSGLLDPATGLLVASAASEALGAGENASPDQPDRHRLSAAAPDSYDPDEPNGTRDLRDPRDPDDAADASRETAESDLTRALHEALDDGGADVVRGAGGGEQLIARLSSANHRVQLARRFHNQAVADTQRVRRKRVVRWFHLAGRAELPQTFEMDDEPPEALAQP